MPEVVDALAARTRSVVLMLFATLAGCAAWAIARTPGMVERSVLAAVLLVPLALPLRGFWRNDRRTFAWAALCLTPHVVYAITEAVANPPMRGTAIAMLLLALFALTALVAHLRLTREVVSD